MARTGLAEYLLKRFDSWKKDRQTHLEPKWQAALNAMKRVDDDRKKKFKKDEAKDWRDDSYIGIIKAKIYTVYSILVEILLSRGEIPFSLEASRYQRDLMDDEQRELLDAEIDKMEDLIREQQADRRADLEMMKKLLSVLIYSCVVSKYNVEPVVKSEFKQMPLGEPSLQQYAEPEMARFEEVEEKKAIPGHIYVSVWNMFWDMEGGDLQKNDGYCERQLVTVNELRKKKGKPYFINASIDRIISEFRSKNAPEDSGSLPPGQREITDRKKGIRLLEFWCRAPQGLVKSMLADINEGVDPSEWDFTSSTDREETDEEMEILCEMADDEIIRLAPNDTGQRPHKLGFWEHTLDELVGDGIPDNMQDVQHLLNGQVRAFMDNKKLSANVILALKQRYLQDPSQLDNGLKPGTTLDIADSCDDVRKAAQQVIIQDVGHTLTEGIGLVWSWKDTLSQVPEILQGTAIPKQKPDTAYELSQLLQFGSKYIAMGVANFDEAIIEPEVTDLFRYNMMDPNVTEGKGNWKVHAQGFETIQQKLVRSQKLKELLGLLFSVPQLLAYAKVRPHLEGIYKGMDLDPDEFLKTEKEFMAEMQAQQQAQVQAQQQALALQAAQEEKARQSALQEKVLDRKMESEIKEQDFQRAVIKEGIKAAGSAKKRNP